MYAGPHVLPLGDRCLGCTDLGPVEWRLLRAATHTSGDTRSCSRPFRPTDAELVHLFKLE